MCSTWRLAVLFDVQVDAAKGVVIASGDYGADPEMTAYYCPQAARFGSDLMISTTNTGDLHKQAMWVGAAMQNWSDHAPSGFCGDAHPIWNLIVNKDCQRFTNEYASTSSLSWSILQQKDGKNYSLFNERYASRLPYVPGTIGADVPTPEQMTARWDTYVEQGVCCKEDTIEALAEDLGLDPAALRVTVDNYNAMCAEGRDADFHKPANLLFPLDEPPYYGFRNGACMLTVHGGLHVDESERGATAAPVLARVGARACLGPAEGAVRPRCIVLRLRPCSRTFEPLSFPFCKGGVQARPEPRQAFVVLSHRF